MDANLAELAKAIAAQMQPLNEHTLWDADDCAAYIKVAHRQWLERFACRTDCPKPIRLPTNGGRGTPRWKAMEIIEWIEGF